MLHVKSSGLRRFVFLTAALVAVVAALFAFSANAMAQTVYDSIPNPVPANLPSLGFAATSTQEFGDDIQFVAGANGKLQSVTVLMSSWACETGEWTGEPEECQTTPGATFSLPATFNIYSVNTTGSQPAPETPVLATATATFDIPFRPSANPAICSDTSKYPTSATAAEAPLRWYDQATNTCNFGFAVPITFDFSSQNIMLPSRVIYGLAYNTLNHGYEPMTVHGPYDSLNFALASAVSNGTDVNNDVVMWNTSHAAFYTDGGTAGVNLFRFDTGWSSPLYIPAAEFTFAGPSVYVPDDSLKFKSTESTFSFPVKLNNPDATVGGTGFSLSYDDSCLDVSVAQASGLSFGSFDILPTTVPGRIDIGITGPAVSESEVLPLASGDLAIASVTIDSACRTDKTFTFAFATGATCSDKFGASVACSTDPGEVYADFNSAPTDISPNILTIAENAGDNATIGTFVATDPDAEDAHDVSFVLDAAACSSALDNGLFGLNSTGVLTALHSFNFEAARTSFQVCALVTDGHGESYHEVLTVNVTNVNEFVDPPPFFEDPNISENWPANVTFAGFEPPYDEDGDHITYTFVAGEGDTDNALFGFGSIDPSDGVSNIFLKEVPNHEVKDIYSVRVRAQDGNGGEYEWTFTISVLDVNEAPTILTLTPNKVGISVPEGMEVGVLGATDDPDSTAGVYAYAEAAEGDGSYFDVVGDKVVKSATMPPTAGTYTLNVTVTDSSFGSPAVTTLSVQIVVKENATLSLRNAGSAVIRKNHGQITQSVEVIYAPNDNTANSLNFDVTWDSACLALNDALGTEAAVGIGSSVKLDFSSLSSGVRIILTPKGTTNLPAIDGPIAKFFLKALPGCDPTNTMGFSEDKALHIENVSYKDGAANLSITSSDGAVTVIDNSHRGDCNASDPLNAAGPVNAADYVATVLEIFDADHATSWLSAPLGGFDGSPYGCDSSQDGEIAVNDITCTVHESFGSHCANGTGINPAAAAALNMAAASANAGAMVNVPLSFDAQGASIGALVFTLKLDPAKAAFDATDADGDGNPDALHFNLADGQSAMAIYDAAAGKIHVAVFSITESMQPISGDVVSVDLLSLAGGDAGLVIESASASTVDGASVPVSGAMGGQAFLPDQFFNYLPVLISQ
jgi:hypothetical protein